MYILVSAPQWHFSVSAFALSLHLVTTLLENVHTSGASDIVVDLLTAVVAVAGTGRVVVLEPGKSLEAVGPSTNIAQKKKACQSRICSKRSKQGGNAYPTEE
jgi:hypothetical protein